MFFELIKAIRHQRRMRKNADYACKYGVGPYTPQFCTAFIDQRCQQCGIRIALASILGNALVVHKQELKLHCRQCRGCGTNMDIPDAYLEAGFQFDGQVVIGELYSLVRDGNSLLDYYMLLMCLRGGGIASFQGNSRDAWNGWNVDAATRGFEMCDNPDMVKSCPECGASISMKKKYSLRNNGDSPSDVAEYCASCGTNYDRFWFRQIRPAFEEPLLISGIESSYKRI